jgi:hypothetical protein
MMRVRAIVAVLVSSLLAFAGLIAVATPARAAVSGTYPTVYCQINNVALGALSISTNTNWTIQMAISPANAAAGADVTITVSSAQTPKNGPAIALPAGGTQMEPVLDVEGTEVIAKSAPNAAEVPVNADIFPSGWSATATFPAPLGGGSYNAVLKKIVINSFSGSNTTKQTDPFDSNCALDNNPSVAPFTPFDLSIAGSDGAGPGPTTSSPAPTTSSPAPTTSSPAPTTSSPAPTTSSPAPTTSSPAPTTSSPTPGPSASPVVVTGMNCEIFSGAAATVTRWEQASKNSTATDSPSPTLTFAADKLTVAAGDKVSLALSFSQGPQSGPIELAAGVLQPKAKVTVGGAGSGSVVLTGAKYGLIPPYSWVPGTTLTGTYTATAAGAVTFTLAEFGFDYGDSTADASFGYPTKFDELDTVCNKGAKPKEAPATIGLPAQLGAAAVPVLPETLPTSNGDLTVTGAVTAGGSVTLSGEGFAPSSIVAAGIYSAPVALGSATASVAGAVSVVVTIPSTFSGEHTLALYGADVSGGEWTLTKSVTVTAATGTPTSTSTSTTDPTDDPDNGGTLPQTGPGDFAMTLVWALIALQVGLIIAVRASRARRPAAAPTGRHRR